VNKVTSLASGVGSLLLLDEACGVMVGELYGGAAEEEEEVAMSSSRAIGSGWSFTICGHLLVFPLLTELDNKLGVGEESPSTTEIFARDFSLDPGKAIAAALAINRGSINPNGVEPLDFRMLSKLKPEELV